MHDRFISRPGWRVLGVLAATVAYAAAQDDFREYLRRDRESQRQFSRGEQRSAGGKPAAPPARSAAEADGWLVVSPGGPEATCTWTNGAAIAVPAGAVTNRTAFAVRRLPAPDDAPVEPDGFRPLSAWELKIEPPARLQADVTLRLPYDAARLNPRVPPGSQVLVAERVTGAETWEPRPSRPVAGQHAVEIDTRASGERRCVSTAFEPQPRTAAAARSIEGVVTIGGLLLALPMHFAYEWKVMDSYLTPHTRILCDAEAIRAHAAVGDKSWPTNGPGCTNATLSAAPRFAKDVAGLAEQAWTAYHKAGYPMPAEPFTIKLDPTFARLADVSWNSWFSLEWKNSWGLYDWTWKRAYLPTHLYKAGSPTNMERLQEAVAHEVFHGVQQRMFGDCRSSELKSLLLCIESTAKYAGNRVPWQLDGMSGPDRCPRLLNMPLAITGKHKLGDVTCEDVEYLKGLFIEYLAKAPGFDFQNMLWSVARNRTPDAEDMFLPRLNAYLRSATGVPLRDHYRGFVPYYLFDDECAKKVEGTYANQYTMVDANVNWEALNWSAVLPPHFASMFWAIGSDKDWDRPGIPMSMEITALSGDVVVDVVTMPGRHPVPDPDVWASLKSVGATCRVTVGPDPSVVTYLLAINRGGTEGRVRIEAGPVWQIDAQGICVDEGPTADVVQIHTLKDIRLGASGGKAPYTFRWRYRALLQGEPMNAIVVPGEGPIIGALENLAVGFGGIDPRTETLEDVPLLGQQRFAFEVEAKDASGHRMKQCFVVGDPMPE